MNRHDKRVWAAYTAGWIGGLLVGALVVWIGLT